MTEPWFNPALYAWIPGTLLGIAGGTWGTLLGVFASRGLGKSVLFAGYVGMMAYSILCFAVGVAAFFLGQPWGVWYGFGLTGLIGLMAIGPQYFTMRHFYQRAELRQMEAKDL